MRYSDLIHDDNDDEHLYKIYKLDNFIDTIKLNILSIEPEKWEAMKDIKDSLKMVIDLRMIFYQLIFFDFLSLFDENKQNNLLKIYGYLIQKIHEYLKSNSAATSDLDQSLETVLLDNDKAYILRLFTIQDELIKIIDTVFKISAVCKDMYTNNFHLRETDTLTDEELKDWTVIKDLIQSCYEFNKASFYWLSEQSSLDDALGAPIKKQSFLDRINIVPLKTNLRISTDKFLLKCMTIEKYLDSSDDLIVFEEVISLLKK